MTASIGKGLLLGLMQIAIVSSLGVKLMVDRSAYPRVWARAAPVDPSLPIRGRYVSLRLEARIGPGLDLPMPRSMVAPNGRVIAQSADARPVVLAAEEGALVARPSTSTSGLLARARQRGDERVAELIDPLAYFIPDGIADPSRRAAGEELWVEVTIPRRGAPRPIRLGVKKDGTLTPLD